MVSKYFIFGADLKHNQTAYQIFAFEPFLNADCNRPAIFRFTFPPIISYVSMICL